MSVASTRPVRRGIRYRSRRPIPALVLLAVLVLVSGFVWTRVFENRQTTETATTCNPPSAKPGAAQQPVGTPLPRNGLDDAPLVPPQDVATRVLNGNGQARQATLVSDELTSLGFAKGPDPGNDPSYPNQDLKCHGQIRFGQDGAGEARTLSLMIPCAQLVRDERTDRSVDLALGSRFEDIKPKPEARQVLDQLKDWEAKRDQGDAGAQEVSPPKVDGKLLKEARDVSC